MNTVLLHLCIVGKDVLDWNQTSDTRRLLVGFFYCYEWNIPYFMNEHQQQQRIICMPETHPRTHGSKFKLRPKTAANVKTSPIHTQHNMTSEGHHKNALWTGNVRCFERAHGRPAHNRRCCHQAGTRRTEDSCTKAPYDDALTLVKTIVHNSLQPHAI